MGGSGSDDNLDSTSSSDHLQWQKIFNSLVEMLRSQHSQLETLAMDRKLLQDRIQIQHQRWLSDAQLLEDHISQLKNNFTEAEMGRLLEVAKSDLVVGMKEREAFFYKSISGWAGIDLEDMQQVIVYLTQKLSGQKPETDKRKGGDGDLRTAGNTKEEEKRMKSLREEIRRLKQASERLSSQKNSEVSALVAERNFVWNQFKKMESDYTHLLKSKRVEVEQAHENIAKLEASMEKLQLSTKEKDDIILKLKAEVAKFEMDMGAQSKEISKLSKELELLRSSTNASLTPVVSRRSLKSASNGGSEKRHPVNKESSEPQASKELELLRSSTNASLTPVMSRRWLESSSRCLESASNGGSEKRHPVNKESSKPQASGLSKSIEKGSKSSKRKGSESTSKLETPRLFTAAFKVPKLKNSSPLA